MKKFETWTFNGKRFLAARRASDVLVCDESGGFYGAWMTVSNFRQAQAGTLGVAPTVLGEFSELAMRTNTA